MGGGEGVKTKMKSQEKKRNALFALPENLCSTGLVGMFVCLFLMFPHNSYFKGRYH